MVTQYSTDLMTNQKHLDKPSLEGRFGWEKIGSEGLAIPVIERNNALRYCPVRIVEQEIIKKFDLLPQDLFKCITLRSFYLTPQEAKLMNLINFNHCNTYYGEQLFTTKEVIISTHDVKELLKYLNVSMRIFNNDASPFVNTYGVVKIQLSPNNADLKLRVPYLGKLYSIPQMTGRFVPLKIVEQYFTSESLSNTQGGSNDWDVMYLKMLSIYAESNTLSHISKDSTIVLLDSLRYKSDGSKVIYDDYIKLAR